MHLSSGSMLGPYRIQSPLGAGGMGHDTPMDERAGMFSPGSRWLVYALRITDRRNNGPPAPIYASARSRCVANSCSTRTFDIVCTVPDAGTRELNIHSTVAHANWDRYPTLLRGVEHGGVLRLSGTVGTHSDYLGRRHTCSSPIGGKQTWCGAGHDNLPGKRDPGRADYRHYGWN